MTEFLFNLCFDNGYVFKNLLTIFKKETKTATMILSPDNIKISFVNSNSEGLHIIDMNPHENIEWFYNATDEEGNLLESYPIGFNCFNVYNTLKNIGTNDSVRLFLIKGQDTVMVQPIKSAAKDGQFKILKFNIIQTEYIKYEVDNYKSTPNIKIHAKSFSDLCSEVSNVNCEYVNIEGDGESVTFRGFDGSKTEVYINRFDDLLSSKNQANTRVLANNINDIDALMSKTNTSSLAKPKTGLKLKIVSNDNVVVRVPKTTFKSLAKIDKIAPKGSILRFYLEKNQPIKIETGIGTFGTYQIYLK